jgi:hypothetical protein
MPRPRIGVLPMTAAQRQARRRTRLGRTRPLPLAPPARRPLPRPQRWAAAVAILIALQDEYRAWLDNLPTSLEGSRLAEKLQAITELNLEELQAIDPPRGYGRDRHRRFTIRSPSTVVKLLNLTDTTRETSLTWDQVQFARARFNAVFR